MYKYLHQFGPQKGVQTTSPHPPPPQKGEKLFAFLDELDHFMNKLKSVIMTSDPPPPHPR